MIIRRRHTANFTTIGNTLFKDERLAADEVGVIATLLSMPNDWEVRRPALARRWRLGRDSIKRIIHSAMRTGWIIASKTRLSNGTFHIIYEVRDEPGPELSAEEIMAALSLVSSDAGQDESADNEGHESTEPDADPCGQPPTENPSWGAGQPSLAQPSPVNPSRSIEDSLKTDSLKTESTKGVRAFQAILGKWPINHVLSRIKCESLHASLTDADQEAAIRWAGPYVADRASQGAKLCDLSTYYHERRWERLAAKGSDKPKIATFRVRSPQWWRWREHNLSIGKSIKFMESYANNNPVGMWSEPSEWPPRPTGPPPGEITAEDAKAFAGE